MGLGPLEERQLRQSSWVASAVEVLLILAVFFLFAGGPAPDVNEAHYLAKAKHFWNPAWCPGDHFLSSDDGHAVFFWTFGWVTLFLPLPATAWLGRVLIWLLLAWGWQRVSYGCIPCRLLAVLTAALFVCLTHYAHFAGEWVVGGVEAKGFSFACLLFGLGYLVRDQWAPAWLFVGLATAFHVLVGGWSLCALLLVSFVHRGIGRTCQSWCPILVAVLFALPGIWPAIQLTDVATSEQISAANEIYVFERLSHHLVFHRIFYSHGGIFAWRFGALLLGWICCAWFFRRNGRVQRLNALVAAAVSIALIGVLVDQLTLWNRAVAAFWLRFYWFRLADVMVPLGVAIGAGVWWHTVRLNRYLLGQGLLLLLLLGAGTGLAARAFERRTEKRPAAAMQADAALPDRMSSAWERYADWVRVCQWIRTNTRPESRFLTPLRQQTFKWYAHRSEVATRKDVPQNARSLLQWHQRMEFVTTFQRQRGEPGALPDLLAQAVPYGITHIVIDRPLDRGGIPLARIYPLGLQRNRHFFVYRVMPR